MWNPWRTLGLTKWSPSAARRGRSARGKLQEREIPVIETLEDRNLLSFVTSADYDIGVTPQAVAVADVNGDKIPDLIVVNGSNQGAGSVSVLLGHGDGTFQPAQSYAVGSAPDAVAVGDFTGDGIPDLAVANSGSNSVSILVGNGDGSFRLLRNFATGSNPSGVAVADLRNDGILDLIVTNAGNSQVPGNVSVLLGNGDGTFHPPQDLAVGTGPQAVAVGDFNGDGTPDLAVTVSAGVNVLLGNGDGSFRSAGTFAAGTSPGAVVVGDFNGDGVSDLAVANNSFGLSGVSVLLGNGDGSFQAPHTSSVRFTRSASLAVGDFDGNGLSDLALVSTGTISGGDQVTVLRSSGDGFFQPPEFFQVGGLSTTAVAAGDFNGDGVPDLAVTSGIGGVSPGVVSVLLGNGDGSFQTTPHYAANSPVAVVVADFNGDGIPDLAVVNISSNTVSISWGTGTAPSSPHKPSLPEVVRRRWSWRISTGTAAPTWPWPMARATT